MSTTTKKKGAGLLLHIQKLFEDSLPFEHVKPSLHRDELTAKKKAYKLGETHLPLKDDGDTHIMDMEGQDLKYIGQVAASHVEVR